MASEGATIEHGMLVRQWKWPLRVLFWWVMITAWVVVYAVSVQWLWAWQREPQAMLPYAERILVEDAAALDQLRPGLFKPGDVALWINGAISGNIVGAVTGVARAIMNWPATWAAARTGAANVTTPRPSDAGAAFVSGHGLADNESWGVLLTAAQLFAVRTAIFISALPMALLCMALGLVDGLAARARRKACAGRESASLYHRAKLGLSLVAILAYLLCLGLPSLAEPELVLVPMALLLGVLFRTQCAYYKKYL